MNKTVFDTIEYLTKRHNDAVFEIRIPKAGGENHTVSGYFSADQTGTAEEAVRKYDNGTNNIYITMNPVNPALSARANNRLRQNAKETSKDGDIMCRHFLLVDTDPIRPSNISSTNEEKEEARKVIDSIREYLCEQGWPKPLCADSGNGFHLLYMIDLPNEPEANRLVKLCLLALDAKFSTEKVSVDKVVYNAARVLKLYGTIACKGDSTCDRPHRRSQTIEIPEKAEVVSEELLKKLAAMAPVEQITHSMMKTKITDLKFDVPGFLERHNIPVKQIEETSIGTMFILENCFFNPEHRGKDSAVIVLNNGAIGYKCFHDSCQAHTWQEMREKLEPGCYDRKSFDDYSENGKKMSQNHENQATLLYNNVMMERHDSFSDTQGNAYYVTIKNGVKRTYQINSTEFNDFLRLSYKSIRKTLLKNDTIKNVSDQIAAEIRGQNNIKEIFIRIGIDENTETLYLDLANEKREVVKITKDGWEVTTECPVVFRRGTGQQSLPYPVKGGSLELLRPFINCSDEDFILICAFIIGVFQYGKPFINLIINGEQGSGKSTTERVIKILIDPSKALSRALPREEKNLFIAAMSNWILSYDNASRIPEWLSDALCRLSTGGGWGERKKYTDDEEVVYESMRPVILNGIYDMIERADLMDRAITVTSLKIPDEKRLTEDEYYKRFREQHPLILGAILDAVVNCLRNHAGVTLPQTTRMADFTKWVYAAAPAIDAERFLSIYLRNREGAREALLQGDIITDGFLRVMHGKLEWKGTANELLEAIKSELRAAKIDPPTRPKDGRALTRHLKNIAPNIRKNHYIDIQFPEYTTKNQGRILTIVRIPPEIPPEPDRPPDESGHYTPTYTPILGNEENIGVISEHFSEYAAVRESENYSDTPTFTLLWPPFQPSKSVIKQEDIVSELPTNIEGKSQCKNIGVNGVTEFSPEFEYDEGEI